MHLIIRNIPFGYSVSAIRQLLTTSRTQDARKWVFDIRVFHKTYDPYEEISQPQMMGIPVAEIDDPFFDNIPAVLSLEEAQLPVIINLSCHSCDICTSNHRTRDHQWFAMTRRKNLPNRYTITVVQLQNLNGTLPGVFAMLHTSSTPLARMHHNVVHVSHAAPHFMPYRLEICYPLNAPLACAFIRYVLLPIGQSPTLYPYPWSPGSLATIVEGPFLPNFLLPSLCCTLRTRFSSAKLLGQTPVPLVVKADPGILYIGSEDNVELWTCAICDFECGPALDSAFTHIRSPEHGLRLMQTESQTTALETWGPMKAHDLEQREEISSFLASLI
ncbi:unnamed protein product [Closterium sp. Yama58-4]|nr:unnamed protein product [Closterium sp. Yama58-4]